MRQREHAFSATRTTAKRTPNSSSTRRRGNALARRGHLTLVSAHAGHLDAIVGSILSVARSTGHDVPLELSNVHVRTLLHDAHVFIEPFAVAGDVSVVVDCERAPEVVYGDPTALMRVLLNLAASAVRFTPSGGRVTLSALADAGGVELRVADTGPGIEPDRMPEIFKPFVQAHTSDEPPRRGLELGLSIARDLTRLMGGELFVRSRVGVGSLFAARFPTDSRGTASKAA